MNPMRVAFMLGGLIVSILFVIFGIPPIIQREKQMEVREAIDKWVEAVKADSTQTPDLYPYIMNHFSIPGILAVEIDQAHIDLQSFFLNPTSAEARLDSAFLHASSRSKQGLLNIEHDMIVYLGDDHLSNSKRDLVLEMICSKYIEYILLADAGKVNFDHIFGVERRLHSWRDRFEVVKHEEFAKRIWQEASIQGRISALKGGWDFSYSFTSLHPLSEPLADSYFNFAMENGDLDDAKLVADHMKWDKFDERRWKLNQETMRRDFFSDINMNVYSRALEIALKPDAPEEVRAMAQEVKEKVFAQMIADEEAQNAFNFALEHNLPPAKRKLAEDLMFMQAAREGPIGLARPLSDNGEAQGPAMLVVVAP